MDGLLPHVKHTTSSYIMPGLEANGMYKRNSFRMNIMEERSGTYFGK